MKEIQDTVAVAKTVAIPCHLKVPPLRLAARLDFNKWCRMRTEANITRKVGITVEIPMILMMFPAQSDITIGLNATLYVR